jgi:hypothetical protein
VYPAISAVAVLILGLLHLRLTDKAVLAVGAGQ